MNHVQNPGTSIFDHFSHLTDPRIDRTKRHNLLDIVALSICWVICGADGWTEIEEFGQAKQEWLQNFLELPNGIPSHFFPSPMPAICQAHQSIDAATLYSSSKTSLSDMYFSKAASHPEPQRPVSTSTYSCAIPKSVSTCTKL
jgi:hypothetical protein